MYNEMTEIVEMFESMAEADYSNSASFTTYGKLVKELEGQLSGDDIEFVVAQLKVTINDRVADEYPIELNACIVAFAKILVQTTKLMQNQFPLYWRDAIKSKDFSLTIDV